MHGSVFLDVEYSSKDCRTLFMLFGPVVSEASLRYHATVLLLIEVASQTPGFLTKVLSYKPVSSILYYVHNCMLLSIFFVHIMNFKFDYSKFVMDFSIVNL